MEVLVTGPDGVLGSNLVRELLKQGYSVTAMSENGKKSPTIDNLDIKKIGGNLLNAEDLIKATEGIDVVIHCAASTSMFPARSEIVNKVNIDGTEHVVNACLKNKVKRMIYVGTANSFGSGKSGELGTEVNDYRGGKYGLDYMDSKYKAQLLVLDKVKNEGLDAIVVNPTFMIGPHDSGPSSGEMILKLYHRKVPGYTLGGKNFVAVKDVAVAITNAITKGKKGECYILGHENLTYKDAFEKIAATVGVNPPKRKLATGVVLIYGRMSSFFGKTFKFKPGVTKELSMLSAEQHYYSPAKAVKELEMPQTPIEIAVKECFDWFTENNYLPKK